MSALDSSGLRRKPDGSIDWSALQAMTPGAGNAQAQSSWMAGHNPNGSLAASAAPAAPAPQAPAAGGNYGWPVPNAQASAAPPQPVGSAPPTQPAPAQPQGIAAPDEMRNPITSAMSAYSTPQGGTPQITYDQRGTPVGGYDPYSTSAANPLWNQPHFYIPGQPTNNAVQGMKG